MARPTDFSPAILQQAKDYLSNWSTEHKHTIPSVVGLAVVLSRHKSVLYGWAEEQSEEFGDILDKIVQLQEIELLNSGLNGTFNAQITKLVLGKHGYHDKVDQELTGKGGAPVSFLFTGVESDGRRS